MLINAAQPVYFSIRFGEADPLELGIGNAKVAEAEGVGDADPAGDAEDVAVGDAAGVGVGVGVGGGGIIFSQ